ncbi:MAG: hypothetical protein A2W00_14125 [Candidatus Eisenbacteria bacterium RBG_16_71_46]|nr:MAG: hypothetical protein A2W00_14125 [Candidatus Eisenbacteria bacterium RBG_16_71_46]
MRSLLHALAAALALAATAAPAAAQYFGQNKVRYRSFDFRILKTGHFDIYYYPVEEKSAREVAVMAERWYERLSKSLHHELSRRQPLILYASHPEFEQTNAIPGNLGEGTGGVTEFLKRRIVLPLAGPLAETDHVVGHELVHAFQFDIGGQGSPVAGVGSPAVLRLPLWFMEGMAEYLSIGPSDPNTAMWMRDAVHARDLPGYNKLYNPRYFPYRFGQALWAYIAGRWGEGTVARLLGAAAVSGDASVAIRSVLGTSPDSLILGWQQDTRSWTAPIAAATDSAPRDAHALVVSGKDRGHLNLSPSLSPDGRQMVLFSAKNRYSIELYLVDAETGRFGRPITKTAVDPHFQSLEFINSAGAWSPDGKRLALAAVSGGHAVLTVMDVASGRREKEVRFKDLGEILGPTWSPDGKRIAFSALRCGVTDLWLLDLETAKSRRLTDDSWTEIEPAWSPRGDRIAFVTDRTSAPPLEQATVRYTLALIDPETAAIDTLHGFDRGKHIDPQWSADGSSLYFVSDPDGISNIYRLRLEGGAPERITNLLTGVSGLTPLGPTLSVSRDGSRMAFTTFEGGNFNVYTIAAPDARPAVAAPPIAALEAALLPPLERTHPAEGPTAERPAPIRADTLRVQSGPYRAGLSLDYVGQAGVGIGAGTSGLSVGGGAALYWSDMLGNHNLVTFLQSSSTGGNPLYNLAGGVGYENAKSRWSWGGSASQIPYISTGFTLDDSLLNGELVDRYRSYRFWQIERSAEADFTYPFDRFRRVEFSTGLRNISFKSEVQTQLVRRTTGELLSDQTTKVTLDSLNTLNLGSVGSALVYDSAVFGGTSPILGQSYRLGVTSIFGTINFEEILVDYRRYGMPLRPITLAGRVLHYGRYGPGDESNELQDLFLGYASLIRGYNDASFSSSERAASGGVGSQGSLYDRLLGSKLAVVNLEARVPLLGALGVIPSGGFIPVELAPFFDVGSAWLDQDKPTFLGGPRRVVTSHGVALRVNLFGFAVGELDFVHPNDRPGRGWYWQFALQPGF